MLSRYVVNVMRSFSGMEKMKYILTVSSRMGCRRQFICVGIDVLGMDIGGVIMIVYVREVRTYKMRQSCVQCATHAYRSFIIVHKVPIYSVMLWRFLL